MALPTQPPRQQPPTQPRRPAGGSNGARQPNAARPPALPPAQAPPLLQHRGLGSIWRRVRTTLKGQFIALMVLILALALAQTWITTTLLQRAHADLVTISRDSTPSVDAAQAMAQYIADIDAKAADYIGTAGLTNTQPCAIAGTTLNLGQLTVHACSDQTIEAETILFNREVYKAIRNVTYPGERTALDRIAAGFQEYMGQIDVMRHEFDQATSKTDPNDEHLRRAREAYVRASDVLHTKITQQLTTDANGAAVLPESAIPDCTIGNRVLAAKDWPFGSLQDAMGCFNSINKGYLDRAYDATVESIGFSLAFVILSSLVFCAALLFITWRMAALTHRVINLGLTVALVLGVGYSATVAARFADLAGSQGLFKRLVKDSYDSVYYAAILKRVGTDANADESRWLIAVQFNDPAAADHWFQDWQANTKEVQTYIARAIGNETYPEEREPLSHIQQDWNAYAELDPQIREKARADSPNRIIDAETLSTGASNQAFGVFTDTIDRLSDANRAYYNRFYADTDAVLSRETFLSAVLFPLIGLAALWGMYVRLKDL